MNSERLSAGDVAWIVGADGSLSSTGGYWEMATDAADLRDKLRRAVPDTALRLPAGPSRGLSLILLGISCLAGAAVLARSRRPSLAPTVRAWAAGRMRERAPSRTS